MNNLSAKWTK